MNSLVIKIEVVAGTEFKEAVKDAKKLAGIFGDAVRFVSFNFNESHVLVSEYSPVNSLVRQFNKDKKYIA
jgi:hypothetical protein